MRCRAITQYPQLVQLRVAPSDRIATNRAKGNHALAHWRGVARRLQTTPRVRRTERNEERASSKAVGDRSGSPASRRWPRRTRLRLGVSRPETSSGKTSLERGSPNRPLATRWRPGARTSSKGRAEKVTSGAAAKSAAQRVAEAQRRQNPGGDRALQGLTRFAARRTPARSKALKAGPRIWRRRATGGRMHGQTSRGQRPATSWRGFAGGKTPAG
jgi:hypothetical protein